MKTYKVCKNCKRIIGTVVLPETLAPLGKVDEHGWNCPVCKTEKDLKK